MCTEEVTPQSTRMKTILAAASACGICVCSNVLAANSSPDMLNAKLRELSGASAKDCGSIPREADAGPAISCAKDADDQQIALRVAIQIQGVDSIVWAGAARDNNDKHWTMTYDFDPSGRLGNHAVVHAAECTKVRFFTRSISCADRPFMP
jgi:hypothetical protein